MGSFLYSEEVLGPTLGTSVTRTLKTLLHYLNGEAAPRREDNRARRRAKGSAQRKEQKQGQSLSCFMITWVLLESVMELIDTSGHLSKRLASCS